MASRLFAAVLYDKIGINTTHHSDGPIVDAKPMYLVWCAVNRLTASGKVLGPDLRQAPPLRAHRNYGHRDHGYDAGRLPALAGLAQAHSP
jgi:predicted amidohydrolase YtcJ